MRIALIEYTTDVNHRQETVRITHNVIRAGLWLEACRGLVCGTEENAEEAQYWHRWTRAAYLLPVRWRHPTAKALDRARETLAGHIRRVSTPFTAPETDR